MFTRLVSESKVQVSSSEKLESERIASIVAKL